MTAKEEVRTVLERTIGKSDAYGNWKIGNIYRFLMNPLSLRVEKKVGSSWISLNRGSTLYYRNINLPKLEALIEKFKAKVEK